MKNYLRLASLISAINRVSIQHHTVSPVFLSQLQLEPPRLPYTMSWTCCRPMTPGWSSDDDNDSLTDDHEHVSRSEATSDEDDLGSDRDETRDPFDVEMESEYSLDDINLWHESASPKEVNSPGGCAPQHQTPQSPPWSPPAVRLPRDKNPTHTVPDPVYTPAPGPLARVPPYLASLASDLRTQIATRGPESNNTANTWNEHTPDIMKYKALMTFLFAWIYAFNASASLAHLIIPIQRILTDPSSADQMQEALVKLQDVILKVVDNFQSEFDSI